MLAPGGRIRATLRLVPAVWVPVAAALAVVAALAFCRRGPAVSSPAAPEPRLSRGVTPGGGYSPPFAIDRRVDRGGRSRGAGTSRLYLRPLDDVVLHPLAGTEGGHQPFFSPDGR